MPRGRPAAPVTPAAACSRSVRARPISLGSLSILDLLSSTRLRASGPRSSARWADLRGASLAAALPLVSVGALAAANGGYFPTEWGWAALGFLLLAAGALATSQRIALSRLELGMLGALGGLAAWQALSALWSPSPERPLLETERTLVYFTGLLAVFLIVSKRSLPHLLGGLLTAITGVCAYALATRLFPDVAGGFDATGYQLSRPLGYWNALGLLAVIGVLLAFGFATEARRPRARALAAASLPVLVTGVYFTFSRGAWLALALGLAAALALGRRRLRTSVLLFALAPGPALALWLASRSAALTHEGAPLESAVAEGHRLALALAGLAGLAGGSALLLARAEGRLSISRRLRIAYPALVGVVAALLFATVAIRVGNPFALTQRVLASFEASPTASAGDLNGRLLSLSGNGRADYWRVAWREYRAHPWLGSGAGSYERHWLRDRREGFGARNAHSLYLETLAELGPLGLAVLLSALAAPLLALARARRRPLGGAATAAYLAFLAHASIDWDWQVTALGLTALLSGAALLVGARRPRGKRAESGRRRLAALAVVVPLAAFAFVSQVGQSAVAAADGALARDDSRRAETHARRAISWNPWSVEARRLLGEAALEQGDLAAAAASFREAISRDRLDWRLWYDLALASRGSVRREALGEARRLNPLSPEIASLALAKQASNG